MKVRLGTLRRVIREEVGRAVQWSAGFGGGGLGGGAGRVGPMSPPEGLGDEAEEDLEDEEYGKEQKVQIGARAEDREGRA